YLLAYATYALGPARVTGASLARAVAHLVPPGPTIDVGPSGIFDALNALAGGGRIALNRATRPRHFRPPTPEAPADPSSACIRGDADAAAVESVESGLTYDAASRALRGAMRCP